MAGVLNGVQKKLGTAMGSSGLASAIIDQCHSPVITVGAATPEVGLTFGDSSSEGLQVAVLDETVTLTNAVHDALTSTIPAGAVVLSAQLNLETAVTGDGTGDTLFAKVGLGTAADPDKYALTGALTLNAKASSIPDWAVLGSAETVVIKAAKTDGTAATEKFTAGGIVRVRIVYLTQADLADAS